MDSLSVTLSAVADPTRRAILRSLVDGPAPVTELARPYRMSQQAISKHVAYLEKAQLIEKRRDGRLHICKLTPAPLKEIAEWTEKYRQYWEASFQRLDALLDELQARPKLRGAKKRMRSDR